MSSIVRLFCALPLVAALIATPAAAATTIALRPVGGEPLGTWISLGTSLQNPDENVSRFYDITINFDGLNLVNAALMANGLRHWSYYSPGTGNPGDYLGNEDGHEPTCSTANGCLKVISPGLAKGVLEIPASALVPCEGPPGFTCGQWYTYRYTMLDSRFIEDGSGRTPWATVAFQARAVPEPSTWALMITGFALAGAALRRTRRPAFAA